MRYGYGVLGEGQPYSPNELGTLGHSLQTEITDCSPDLEVVYTPVTWPLGAFEVKSTHGMLQDYDARNINNAEVGPMPIYNRRFPTFHVLAGSNSHLLTTCSYSCLVSLYGLL